jgi:transcriptional regulator with XRE-family HTH domain
MQAAVDDSQLRQAISCNVRRLLGERGLSQSALSRATGDPLTTINALVNAKCTTNIGTLKRIADALQVGVDQLLEPTSKKSRRAS